MISLIKVKCPHCGAEGQIMVPPLGAIILGPCPECQELVAVFCGQVLALDKQIMLQGDRDARKEHLFEVLQDFLRRRVDRLFDSDEHAGEEDDEAPSIGYLHPDQDEEDEGDLPEMSDELEEEAEALPVTADSQITAEEVENFLTVDLKLIDNRDYFKAVFE